MKKIKILNIFSGVGGGISTWIKKASINSNNSFEIDAMCFNLSNNNLFVDTIESKCGKCYEMPRVSKKIKNIIKLYRYIQSVIIKDKIDIIHCHIDGYAALIFFVVSKKNKIPIIIHSHRTAIEKYQNSRARLFVYFFNRICNHVMYFLGANLVACGKKAAKFAFGNNKKVKLIFNGINVKYDNYTIDKNDRIILLALGRLNKVKNHAFMLKIAKVLDDNDLNFILYIVGDGDLKEIIKSEIINNHLEDKVKITGYSNNPVEYLKKADFLLLPSFSEGFPTVVVEAQKYSCKVIASNYVTKECDLGIGLVKYMKISTKKEYDWANIIINSGKKEVLERKTIINAIIDNHLCEEKIYEDYFQYLNNIRRLKK